MEDMEKYITRSKEEVIESLYEIISVKNERIKSLEKERKKLLEENVLLKKNKILRMKAALNKICTDIDNVKVVDPWTAYNPVLEAERILNNEK